MYITKKIAATVVFACTAVVTVSAFAEPSTDTSVSSGKTRAEVIAEMEQAGGNLGRKNYEATFNPSPVRASTKTRAEVKAELSENRGDVARNNYLNTTSR
jgi:hypothetical protein